MILKGSSNEQIGSEDDVDIVAGEMLNVFLDDNLDGFADENEARGLKESLVAPRRMKTFQDGRHSIVLAKPDGVEHQKTCGKGRRGGRERGVIEMVERDT